MKQTPAPVRVVHSNAIFRVFSYGDTECWARYDEHRIKILLQHTFSFTGFQTTPHIFHVNTEKTLDRILAEGEGIMINRKVLRLCNGSYDSSDVFPENDSRFAYTKKDKKSADGKTYKLFQDYDNGARGWAIFIVKNRSHVEVIREDHNDNIRNWMCSPDFLSELGLSINLKYLQRENHDVHKPYYPTEEDFREDSHINEKGKKEKA